MAEANLVDVALANAIQMAGGLTPIPSSLSKQPTDISGAFDQIAGTTVPADAQTPVVFSAKEIEDFKISARAVLQAEGMPPEQIEPYLSGMVSRAQAMGWNFPKYTPPEPARVQRRIR